MKSDKLALVAGEGELPLEILRSMRRAQRSLPQVYLLAEDDEPYAKEGIPVQKINNPMAIAATLAKMRLKGVRRMMMAGRVPKKDIYSKDKLDVGAKSILSDVKDRNDHSLLGGVIRYIEKFGIQVVAYEDVIPEMFAHEGHIAGPLPTDDQTQDCEYGLEILKITLPLSFGQSVVVFRRAIVAVEAMEGTDQAIRRAGGLSGDGVLVKGMRADQDRRYDLPVVGVQTLRVMAEAGLKALFVEAGSVLLLDREQFPKEADSLGICVMGVPACRFL